MFPILPTILLLMPVIATSQMCAAVTKIGKQTRHLSKPVHWLTTQYHFAFADWWTERQNFHALRVVNDDLVKGGFGFGKHPHRDAEIFTYMIDGELSHTDSMGNYETLHKGWVQYLSAGTGITHSEMNDGKETCRLLQIWMLPDRRGHTPQYGSSQYTDADRADTLLQILYGTGHPPAWDNISRKGEPIHLHQDVNVFVSENQPHKKYNLPLAPGRAAYVININGELDVNGVALEPSDAAEVENHDKEHELGMTLTVGDKGSHFMVIEMAQLS